MKRMDFFVRLGADPLPYGVYGKGLAGALSGFGMTLLGIAAAVTGALEITFWLVGGAMVVSGLAVRLLAEETLPRLNPAYPPRDFPASA